MSEGSVKVWLAMDAEQGMLRILLNGQSVGRLANAGGQLSIQLDPEYATLQKDLVPYCNSLFANMPETLRAASYESAGFVTNFAGREAALDIPAELRRRIHLGCGPDVRPGWLNIDYRPGAPVGYDAASCFLNYDLRQGLPGLDDKSADVVFSSHFFEHLRHEEAINLMRECRRVLRDDGVARFQMPDFAGTFRAYVAGDAGFLDTCLNTHRLLDQMPEYARNFADVVSRSVYESYTHKYIWDPENLSKALLANGFSQVTEEPYSSELDHPSDIRREYSFYLVARP